jgi:NAD-dependent deacetylase
MPLPEDVLADIADAAQIIKGSKYVIALTGAGVSVESGIRPFRGPGGLWTEKGEPPMDGYRRFEANPKRYWEERLGNARSSFGISIEGAKPNPGHGAFARLEEMGVLKALVTQNIDNLHIAAGSRRVLEIHGNSLKLRCVRCGARFPLEGFDLSTLPPKCPECGGVVKDDVVMFGEPIPGDVLEECQREAERSDCIIVAGTSAVVYPAASLPLIVKEHGGMIIEVNPLETELTSMSDVSIRAPSGEALPELANKIRELLG